MSGNAMISCKFAMQSQVGLRDPILVRLSRVVRCDSPAIYGALAASSGSKNALLVMMTVLICDLIDDGSATLRVTLNDPGRRHV
jgi:hypothetical protein